IIYKYDRFIQNNRTVISFNCMICFFKVTGEAEVYTLSLHDALPIWGRILSELGASGAHIDPDEVDIAYNGITVCLGGVDVGATGDRKSTRLNSSHVASSYAVFCLKKKHHIMNEIIHIPRGAQKGKNV